jgi:hypothetical protein
MHTMFWTTTTYTGLEGHFPAVVCPYPDPCVSGNRTDVSAGGSGVVVWCEWLGRALMGVWTGSPG